MIIVGYHRKKMFNAVLKLTATNMERRREKKKKERGKRDKREKERKKRYVIILDNEFDPRICRWYQPKLTRISYQLKSPRYSHKALDAPNLFSIYPPFPVRSLKEIKEEKKYCFRRLSIFSPCCNEEDWHRDQIKLVTHFLRLKHTLETMAG